MLTLTALKVLQMIAYGVPGFLLLKTKTLSEDSIKVFAKFLLYVCQPALSLYSFGGADKSPELLREIAYFFVLTLVAQVVIILLFTLIFKKRLGHDSGARVCAVASACGNVGFLGLPLLQYLIPDNPEVLAYSATFSISMNIVVWTLGLVTMTGDKKYISAKSIFLNPSMLSFAVAFPLFVFGIKLPDLVFEYIASLAKMSTVVCMTVLGMRLGTKSLKRVFAGKYVWISSASKLILFPCIGALLFAFAPVSTEMKLSAFILCCCPVAAMVQSISETHDGDSETAANSVLATNLICIITIPIMWTLFNSIVL